MEIKRNPSIEEWAFNEVCNNWGSEAREGIHLSDLLSPRKAYWQHILPMKPTIDEVSYWTSGLAVEDKFLRAIGYQKGETKEWEGIHYSPDVFFNFPAEIKSRRWMLAEEGKEAEVYDYYLKQLKGYCAIENKRKGWLIVLSLVEKQDDGSSKPEWAFYDVDFSQADLDNEKTRLIATKNFLGEALKSKNHHLLPVCESWMCGKSSKIMIKSPFCVTCNKEFQTEWGINKHTTSKTGAGHTVKPAEYKVEYRKRCKWWDSCLPIDGVSQPLDQGKSLA